MAYKLQYIPVDFKREKQCLSLVHIVSPTYSDALSPAHEDSVNLALQQSPQLFGSSMFRRKSLTVSNFSDNGDVNGMLQWLFCYVNANAD